MSDPFAPLRVRFVDRVRKELADLREGADAGPIIHRLSGTAGTLGFHEISRLAGVLDLQLAAGDPNPDDMAALIAEMQALTALHD